MPKLSCPKCITGFLMLEADGDLACLNCGKRVGRDIARQLGITWERSRELKSKEQIT